MGRGALTGVIAAVMVVAGCSSGGGSTSAEPTGDLGDAVAVAAAAPGDADAGACEVDRRALETAAEVYFALNGAAPTSVQDLVDAGLLREPSPRFDIDTDGTVTPAVGSPCS